MAQVNFRIDDNVKQEADELFDNLGVSLSAAITIGMCVVASIRGMVQLLEILVDNGDANSGDFGR